MAFPAKLLGEGEHVVDELRPHWKALVLPSAAFVLTAGVASFVAAIVPGWSAQGWVRLAILILALILVLAWSVRPFLRWRTTSYVLTDQRLITRQGVLSRSGRDIPLTRVNDVSFSHSLLGRVLRCGTLVVESAGERGQLVLVDVPRVEQVQRELYRLVEQQDGARR